MQQAVIPTVERTTDFAISAYERAGFLGLFVAMQMIMFAVLLWFLVAISKRYDRRVAENSLNTDTIKSMYADTKRRDKAREAQYNQLEMSVSRVDERVEKLADRHEELDTPFATTQLGQSYAIMAEAISRLEQSTSEMHGRIDRFLESHHGD